MDNKKYVEEIIEAKNRLANFSFEGCSKLELEEEVRYALKHINTRKSYIRKVALATVLYTGTWIEDARWGWSFLLPSTRDCVLNYREVRKELKKGGTKLKLYTYCV